MPELSMDEFQDIMINPFYAINFDPSLFPEHPPMVSKDEWVQVQIQSIIKDVDGKPYDFSEEAIESVKEWLYRLINLLEEPA